MNSVGHRIGRPHILDAPGRRRIQIPSQDHRNDRRQQTGNGQSTQSQEIPLSRQQPIRGDRRIQRHCQFYRERRNMEGQHLAFPEDPETQEGQAW